MAILTIRNATIDTYFPNLKNINITDGDPKLKTKEMVLRLIDSCLRFYIIPYDNALLDAESIELYKSLNFVQDGLYYLSTPADASRKGARVKDSQPDLECKKQSLIQFLEIMGSASCNLTAMSEDCLRTLVQEKIKTLTSLKADIQEDRFVWVIEYNLRTLKFQYYKIGSDTDRVEFVLPFTMAFLWLINYWNVSDQRPNSFKTYMSLPKIKNNNLNFFTLRAETLMFANFVLDGTDTRFVKERVRWRTNLNYESQCAQVDFYFAFYYFQLINNTLTELTRDVTRNGQSLYDVVMSIPGANTLYLDLRNTDNKPDRRMRPRLVFFVRDQKTGNYLGEIAYTTRQFTLDELKEKDIVKRTSNYLRNIVAEYDTNRKKIFNNLPSGPREEESFFFRNEIEIYSTCVEEADPIIRRLDKEILDIEKVITQNLSSIVDKIRNTRISAPPSIDGLK